MAVFKKEAPANAAIPASFQAPRALTAAASRIKLGNKQEAEVFRARRSSGTAAWQTEAWEYYDAISEIKYAFNLVANVVSRIRLYAAVIEDPSEAPTAANKAESIEPELADAAERALTRLDSAYGGQAGLLRDAALNLSVTGECYLVQIPERPGQGLPESWDIRSTDELQTDAEGNYFLTPRSDLVQGGSRGKKGVISLPPKTFAGRIWRAHPRFSEDPDSSLRGLLDLCDELLLINRTFRGGHRSRLNAGMMYLPDGLSIAANPDPENPYEFDDGGIAISESEVEDEFETSFIESISTPIEDETSVASVAPFIVRGPAELGEKIKQFTFERSNDESMIARSDRVLERILQGLDVPKDTVTGMANIKYSNAIQIDESLYKAHIEPMLLLISDALTNVYLRPYLLQQGYTEAEVNRIVVWYDPSSVATRNDRASDADSGYEKGIISAAAWRRAHGFSEADAPQPNEAVLNILMEKGSITPELSEMLLTVIAPEIMQAAKTAQQANSVAPIPNEVQNMLSGQPAAPADPNADPAAGGEAAPTGLAEPEGATPVPDAEAAPAAEAEAEPAEAPVAAGEDAPPFLAEPEEETPAPAEPVDEEEDEDAPTA